MKTGNFHFRVARVDRLAEDVVYLTGELLSGQIHPECLAVIGNTGLEVVIKGVVLIHPANRPAREVTLMVERLPMREEDIVGKNLFQKPE